MITFFKVSFVAPSIFEQSLDICGSLNTLKGQRAPEQCDSTYNLASRLTKKKPRTGQPQDGYQKNSAPAGCDLHAGRYVSTFTS